MKAVIIAYAVMLVAGIGLYFAYTRLPASWRVKVAGWKTNTVAAVIAFAPDAIDLLTHVQAMSEFWAPSETVNYVMKGIGVLMIVLRYITSYEQKEDN